MPDLPAVTFRSLDAAEVYIGEQAGNMQIAYLNIGAAMEWIRDGKHFRAAAATWELYCPMVLPNKSWAYDSTQANRLINASKQARALPEGTPIPMKESHMRSLRQITDDPNEQAAILQLAQTIGGVTTTTIKAAAETIETTRATGGLVPNHTGETMTNAQVAASVEAAEAARRQQQYLADAAKKRDLLANRVTFLSNAEIAFKSAQVEAGIVTLMMTPAQAQIMVSAFAQNKGLKFWATVAHQKPPDPDESEGK